VKSAQPVVLATLVVVAGGCQSDPQDVSYSAIAGNVSPELQGSTERPVDVNRNVAATADMNARLFWDDLGRAFYTDHPSRLSPLPISGTSGNPK
jgi:hypothetical protein